MGRGIGPDDLRRVPSNLNHPVILWFCCIYHILDVLGEQRQGIQVENTTFLPVATPQGSSDQAQKHWFARKQQPLIRHLSSYHRSGVKGLNSEVPTSWFVSGSLPTQNFPLMRLSFNKGKRGSEGTKEANQK